MKIKDSSVKTDFLPEMWKYLWDLDDAWEAEYDYDLTITSGKDSKHTATYSGHYTGTAVDMRTWDNPTSGRQLKKEDRVIALNLVKNVLGENWKVRNESNHFHLRFRPLFDNS